MRKYVVTYERDEDDWWVASLTGVRGVHTQGRTIEEARRRIREALAAAIGEKPASAATLVDRVKMPADVRRILKRALTARRQLEQVESSSQQATAEAARELVKHYSYRDAGELLDLTRARVQQIVAASLKGAHHVDNPDETGDRADVVAADRAMRRSKGKQIPWGEAKKRLEH